VLHANMAQKLLQTYHPTGRSNQMLPTAAASVPGPCQAAHWPETAHGQRRPMGAGQQRATYGDLLYPSNHGPSTGPAGTHDMSSTAFEALGVSTVLFTPCSTLCVCWMPHQHHDLRSSGVAACNLWHLIPAATHKHPCPFELVPFSQSTNTKQHAGSGLVAEED
jgi:hypothetical protein